MSSLNKDYKGFFQLQINISQDITQIINSRDDRDGRDSWDIAGRLSTSGHSWTLNGWGW